MDARRDAASIEAYVAWSSTDALSEHWREDLNGLLDAWNAAHAVAPVRDLWIRRALEALDGR